MNVRNKFLIAVGFAAGLALGTAAYATSTSTPTTLTSPVPQESFSATSLDEYSQMDRDQQLALILGTREDVIDHFFESDPERALCIAELFDVKGKGVEQFEDIKGILNKAAERDIPRSAQEIVERILTHRLCPDRSVPD